MQYGIQDQPHCTADDDGIGDEGEGDHLIIHSYQVDKSIIDILTR